MAKLPTPFPIAALALALTACASPPPPDVDQAAQPGAAYARENCASCHAVAAGQTASPNPAAPTFVQIANTPGMTRMALSAWLRSPHPSMPQLIVAPDHADELSAYLERLRTR